MCQSVAVRLASAPRWVSTSFHPRARPSMHAARNAERTSQMLVRSPALATPSSFHGRPLPASCVGLASKEGKRRFAEALVAGDCEAFFPLSEQFITQDEPAFCGVSSLCMVLNALRVDPGPTRPSVSPIIYGLVSVTCLGTDRLRARSGERTASGDGSTSMCWTSPRPRCSPRARSPCLASRKSA